MARQSPAMKLLQMVWDQQGYQMGHSWARLNAAMQEALSMAIRYGFEFYRGDFKTIYADANKGGFTGFYWLGATPSLGEHYYTLACANEREHGENMSACLAFEAWKGRKPFILKTPDCPSGRRICVGRRFNWLGESVTCTSFKDDSTAFVACAYKSSNAGYERKVAKRFTITHADITAYAKAWREAAKARQQEAAERDAAEAA